MNYDVSVHLGQQMENFLNAYASGDVEAMERTKSNIKDIMKNTGMKNIIDNIEQWDNKKNEEIVKIIAKARDALKEIASKEAKDDIFIDIEEIKKDTVEALSTLEGEYWDSIKNLILKSINEVEDETEQ